MITIYKQNTQHTLGAITMPAKSYKYPEANLTVGNAHVWINHILSMWKRSNNVLHISINDGRHYLAYFKSNKDVDTVINIIKKGHDNND